MLFPLPCCLCVALRDLTKTQDFDEDEVEGIKVNILAAVASLDRGLAANVSAQQGNGVECRGVIGCGGWLMLAIVQHLVEAQSHTALEWRVSRVHTWTCITCNEGTHCVVNALVSSGSLHHRLMQMPARHAMCSSSRPAVAPHCACGPAAAPRSF